MPTRLIRFGFFLLYHHLAFLYDPVAWLVSRGDWDRWRQTSLVHLGPGPVLELAFGTGGLFYAMRQQNITPVGIDLSPYMARITARRLHRQNLSAAITRAAAQHLPFADGYFSNVIATFPTDYIFQPDTLAEVYRVLNNRQHQARLIVVLQGRLRGSSWFNRFIEGLYRFTGQRAVSEVQVLDRFTANGFAAKWHTTTVQKATALLIVAEKISPPPIAMV